MLCATATRLCDEMEFFIFHALFMRYSLTAPPSLSNHIQHLLVIMGLCLLSSLAFESLNKLDNVQ